MQEPLFLILGDFFIYLIEQSKFIIPKNHPFNSSLVFFAIISIASVNIGVFGVLVLCGVSIRD